MTQNINWIHKIDRLHWYHFVLWLIILLVVAIFSDFFFCPANVDITIYRPESYENDQLKLEIEKRLHIQMESPIQPAMPGLEPVAYSGNKHTIGRYYALQIKKEIENLQKPNTKLEVVVCSCFSFSSKCLYSPVECVADFFANPLFNLR